MDFQIVLERLLDQFAKENTRWALIGGFAMVALGAPRATVDIDFLVHRDDMAGIDGFLQSLGYRRIHHSENVSQFDNPSAAWGSLDFTHAFRPPTIKMLERAIEKPFVGGRTIRILRPEDLIGLQVQNEEDEKLRQDFQIMRKNAAERAPKNMKDLLAFLAFANSFGVPTFRRRPVDAGRCLL